MKEDYDFAIADLTRTIELRPDYALAYELRGEAYQKKGDLDHTKADLPKQSNSERKTRKNNVR